MGDKIAIAIVHGVGEPKAGFADGMMQRVRDHVAAKAGAAAADDLVMKEVHWSDVVQPLERELFKRVSPKGPMAFERLREFVMSYAADVIAYQPRPNNRWLYEEIHGIFAATLKQLAAEAGPTAPLCVIAHSLGSVISSNYLYDLEVERTRTAPVDGDGVVSLVPASVKSTLGPSPSPLERGETLTHFFTLGSPLAVWSLTDREFNTPVTVPSLQAKHAHPDLVADGGWWNLYDRQDVLAYPLRPLNKAYERAVRADVEVDVGNVPVNWTPAAHVMYWKDANVIRPIGDALATAWQTLEQRVAVRP